MRLKFHHGTELLFETTEWDAIPRVNEKVNIDGDVYKVANLMWNRNKSTVNITVISVHMGGKV